jgi:hypothetical protein
MARYFKVPAFFVMSDFDRATLVQDRARALQFFRWHNHVNKKNSKLVALPIDILTAVTHEIGQILPLIKPIYPFDVSEIPPDTTTHLEGIQRESPLVTAGIAETFEQSESFTLKIRKCCGRRLRARYLHCISLSDHLHRR